MNCTNCGTKHEASRCPNCNTAAQVKDIQASSMRFTTPTIPSSSSNFNPTKKPTSTAPQATSTPPKTPVPSPATPPKTPVPPPGAPPAAAAKNPVGCIIGLLAGLAIVVALVVFGLQLITNV